jgi:signal transduction histidine kinase/CheY-like chemotaxis protein
MILFKQCFMDNITALKSVRNLMLKALVGFGIIALLFYVTITLIDNKFVQLTETVASISEPNVKLLQLKGISTCLYRAEENVKVYTIRRDTAYLHSYQYNINCINANLDTLQILSADSVQVEKLSTLISARVDLFNKYITLKIGNDSVDLFSQLLKKIKIEKTIAKSATKQNKDISKKNFFSKLFSPTKKGVKTIAEPISIVSTDGVHGDLRQLISQTRQEEKLKAEKSLSQETDITEQESKIANHIFSLLNTMEEDEIAEGITRIHLATQQTSGQIKFITNSLTLFGFVIALLFSYFMYHDFIKSKQLATQKAEESTKLKEAFLANMSHEIRTPMNAIIGFSDILSQAKMGEKEKEYVTIIKSAGENLLTIINDILDISKIEAGMMTFESSNFELAKMFKSLQGMLMRKAIEKNIQLVFSCDANVPTHLFGDQTRLSQILINLVGNAIKFTEKGEVLVHAKILKDQQEIVLVGFSVSDTGIGIPSDKLETIFERFQQADAHTTRQYGGTGLGLSIAKQLVELQGGNLFVTSELSVGSTFSFQIPYAKSITDGAAIQEPEKIYPVAALSHLKILLVEDNKVNVLLIRTLFSENNIALQTAENGKVALEKLKENKFDIILMDMEMPILNGYETTTIIRKQMQNPIPIIAMTANAMAGERAKCLSLGMNDYISKPINATLLFEKIYELTIKS